MAMLGCPLSLNKDAHKRIYPTRTGAGCLRALSLEAYHDIKPLNAPSPLWTTDDAYLQ